MFSGVSRRGFLGGALSAVAGIAFAEAPATSLRPLARPDDLFGGAAPGRAGVVGPSPEELIAKARLGGHVGYAVADARTGVVLESHEPEFDLPPASVAKAVTALYALTTLGSEFKFQTQLVATGPVSDGKVQGDLVLVGNGDPLLDTDALAEMAANLKAAGVRGVSGRFRVYAGALPAIAAIDPAQPDHVGYNPAVGALNLNFNRVHFEWKRAETGWAVAMDARSERFRPAVSMAKMAVVDRDLPTYTYRATGDVDEWTVASKALGKDGSRWLPVRRPDLYVAEVVQVLAAAQGVTLPKPESASSMPAGKVVVSHDSPSLTTIVRLMLKYSTNLSAEVIGLTASARRGGVPGSLKVSAQRMNAWARETFGASGLRFVDHSGLGDASEVTAADMVRLLVKAGPGSPLHALMKEVAPRDADGNTISNAGYTIHAKTGSLNFVSSLAGYVSGDSGTPLAFAIFTGDTVRKAKVPREQMERPDGAKAWAGRSRWLQYQLLRRWAGLYGA